MNRSEKLKHAGILRFGSEQAWREHLSKTGSKGGKAKVKKGFAVNKEAAIRGGTKSRKKSS